MTNQTDVMNALSCSVEGLNITGTYSGACSANANYIFPNSGTSLWNYWQNQYYPYVIKESYPVYIQERAVDKGKQAFELLKVLMDKKLLKVEKVSDFIEAMDAILKTL